MSNDSNVKELDDQLGQHIDDLNGVISEHNKAHEQFSDVQETARQKLKKHLLSDGQDRYHELEQEQKNAVSREESLTKTSDALATEVRGLKQRMRQHTPAAERINNMVHSYLGHGELKITSSETGYQIMRDGILVAGSLSEGEKTAIALSYFMSTLDAEGRKIKDLIVVVDDPVSSLDTKALHYAFSMIKGALEDAGQLILMTHNLPFMNEVKKWLKRRAEEDNAALLFIDVVQVPAGGQRSSSIYEMPKLIRDYESEYHYLFSLALEFYGQSPDDRWKHFYMMPNVLRKVLEIFLAFKVPGSAGLANKIDNLASAGYELDSAKIRALDRLTQLESHADSLDDLVSLSPITIEEAADAAEALFYLMEAVDKDHLKQMRRLCT